MKDLIGHIAFWDGQVIDDIEGYVAGRPALRNPWQEWNAAEAAKRRDADREALVAELLGTHQRMLERLTTVPEIDPEMVGVDTWQHYDEHAREIERWLAAAPS